MSNQPLSRGAVLVAICRWLLAAVGGYSTTLLLSAFVSEALWQWFAINKASVLMWMLLLSFLIYSALVIWVIATRHLQRTCVVMVLANALMFSALEWVL